MTLQNNLIYAHEIMLKFFSEKISVVQMYTVEHLIMETLLTKMETSKKQNI